MFKYVSRRCSFRSEDGTSYELDMTTPCEYETPEDAEKDSSVFRFKRQEGEVRLIVYPCEMLKITEEFGHSVLRPIPEGDALASYTNSEFASSGLGKITRSDDPGFYGGFYSEIKIPSFDEMFPNLKEGEESYIRRGEAFYIHEA